MGKIETRNRDQLRPDVFRQGLAPMAHGREAKLLGEQTAHGCVAGPDRGAIHFRLPDDLDQCVALAAAQADQARRFQTKLVTGTDTVIDDVVGAVPADGKDFMDAPHQIHHIGRRRPDIGDGANASPGQKIAVHGADKNVLPWAVDPRRANNITARTSRAHGLLSRDFHLAVDVHRIGFVINGVGFAAYLSAIEVVVGSEVNDLGVHTGRSFGEVLRPLHIHRSRPLRVPFAIVDPVDDTINDQCRLCIDNRAMDFVLIHNIEVRVLQCENLVLAREARGEVTRHESGRARNENSHRKILWPDIE